METDEKIALAFGVLLVAIILLAVILGRSASDEGSRGQQTKTASAAFR